jgi:hypothetical protein
VLGVAHQDIGAALGITRQGFARRYRHVIRVVRAGGRPEGAWP